jgi:hypothetical protein
VKHITVAHFMAYLRSLPANIMTLLDKFSPDKHSSLFLRVSTTKKKCFIALAPRFAGVRKVLGRKRKVVTFIQQNFCFGRKNENKIVFRHFRLHFVTFDPFLTKILTVFCSLFGSMSNLLLLRYVA